jgi:hypothetical protein
VSLWTVAQDRDWERWREEEDEDEKNIKNLHLLKKEKNGGIKIKSERRKWAKTEIRRTKNRQ